ncbi:hypothetical protein EGW08_005357, partial [Elysia chlorotica]
CHAPDCGKTAGLDIARHLYKNCHNCRGSYYCSRRCRRRDWARHKRDVCHGSRVSSACKRVIHFCGLDPDVKAALSRLARRGFLTRGRGCVMLGFPDLCASGEFVRHGLNWKSEWSEGETGGAANLELLPVYVTLSELRRSKMYGGGKVLQRLIAMCETYNPELKFLLNVGIGNVSNYFNTPPFWPRRCGPTLILTDVPGSWYEAADEFRLRDLDRQFPSTAQNRETDKSAVQRKARELCFSNIQRRLRQRGVSLDQQFPDVYAELVDYVSGHAEHFPSRIIFPVEDHGNGRMFTCVLM